MYPHDPIYDRLVSDWQRANPAPALSTAVFRSGDLLHAAGYGAATVDAVFQTASVGKHFTAALSLLLSASGELPELDAPILRCFPKLPETWQEISLRQLLSHTTGIPAAGYDGLDLSADYSDAAIADAIVAGGELHFPPGTAWEYSNAGYVLAGISIGRLTDRFYGDLLRERIFLPLRMTTAAVTAAAAPGYCRREDGSLVRAPYISPTLSRLADGGLTLSVLDFACWEAALCGEWGQRLREMFVETRLRSGAGCGYGLGWCLSLTARGHVAEHDGSWQGYSTSMVRCLDAGVAAVVLSNLEDADASGLAHTLAMAA